jgi:hypothetical protein
MLLSAKLAEVRAYWEGLREGAALPRRDQIDPRGIAGALENTFLVERVGHGIARFRLAGMQLHDLMGMDVRGMPLTALIAPAVRNQMTEAVETVFACPAIVEVWLEAERSLGRPALEGRMLLLPLVSARGSTDLALGCLAMAGVLGRTPRRFAIAGAVCTGTAQGGGQAAPRPAQVTEMMPGMAEGGRPFHHGEPRPPRAKPHLRLVASRD